jgi:2-phospho-L-lactate guanylyltransferase
VRTLAVLPIKSFGLAKQRLGDAVGAADRRTLARAMAGDVLEALAQVEALGGVIVVSAEELGLAGTAGIEDGNAPGRFARGTDSAQGGRVARGVELVHDPEEAGQSAAARRGIRVAVARGAQRVLLVPGDCPALDPEEVGALLAAETQGIVIVPDRHGSGTNALLISPPTAVAPAFGPGSFARHAALARAAGVRVRVGRLPSLELDVDTPGDLAALRAALAERSGGAPRTRAMLAGIAAVHAA